MSARWKEHRNIHKRYVIRGTLILLTPARFGGRQSDQLTDMPLLIDPMTGKPLLTGASIAGAMRSYLRDWELGYETREPADGSSRAQLLFGDVLESLNESRESYLIVEDSVAETLQSEFRPGVKIDPATHMAAVEESGGQLFDMELLQAGTRFPLYLELALPDQVGLENRLLEGLAIALTGFERKEIGLGSRKRRGFGECEVIEWDVQSYDLKDPTWLVAWIERQPGKSQKGETIASRLGIENLPPDQRRRFCLESVFRLRTSLLIRSGSGAADSPDMVHLKSWRDGEQVPILSGTSLAGALRGRALRIANTISPTDAGVLVENIFGPARIEQAEKRRQGNKPFASRAVVHERQVIGEERVQSRIRIDRFTGGTYPGALFEQQIIQGGDKSRVCVSIELRNPDKRHIGLLLHLLKDLWTGDLPLGGEASVGRGRLEGDEARLVLYSPDQEKPETWIIRRVREQVKVDGNMDMLDMYARAVGGGK